MTLLLLLLLLASGWGPLVSGKGSGTDNDRFFERGSEVIKMRTKKDWKKLEDSNFAWVVAFYRESCGFCALLRPEWDEAAADLKRYVRIAAVDVEDHKTGGAQLSSYVTGRYSFQIEGVPTIKTFVPLTRSSNFIKRSRKICFCKRNFKRLRFLRDGRNVDYLIKPSAGDVRVQN